MMFEFYVTERLRHRWMRLRLYRFPVLFLPITGY
ncbi:YlcG family protein [Escherichia coli]